MAMNPGGGSWLDDIDLDPESKWLSMGTRALGERPWLTGDTTCLPLRRKLMQERPGDVLVVPAAASDAVAELAAMVGEACGRAVPVVPDAVDDPDRAMWTWLATSVAEDLCLLRRGPVEWELEGGVLCFPSRWRFTDRVGRPLREVHGPVASYDPVLADRITSLLDRLRICTSPINRSAAIRW